MSGFDLHEAEIAIQQPLNHCRPSRYRDLCSSTVDDPGTVLLLVAQHRVIALEPMLRVTIMQISVCPRELIQDALLLNAAALMLAHSHSSRSTEPRRVDEYLARALRAVLALEDVLVLD